MVRLTLHQGGTTRIFPAESGVLLSEALSRAGEPLPLPCGGQGRCGRCRVRATGDLAPLRPDGLYPACQTRLMGDADVDLPPPLAIHVEPGSSHPLIPHHPMPGALGCAVDVGTTTLAMRLYDLRDGRMLAGAGCLNPQAAVAADVLGRVQSALSGQADTLRRMVESALDKLLLQCCHQADVPPAEVAALTVTGNTVMLHLLTGTDPAPLAAAPFRPRERFGREVSLLGRRAYLPPCISGFVGADTVCALLSTHADELPGTTLLCDVGTNGELALCAQGRLTVTSTAAGPAFEGAGISCGMSAATGAVDRAWVEGTALGVHVIGGGKALGLCGSGLLDSVAALRQLGQLNGTGACEEDALPLSGSAVLTQQDVRALQLAKAAIAAGIDMLLQEARLSPAQVDRLLLAGGFGTHLPLRSAAAIGLFPAVLASRASAVGNAALDGAALLLSDVTLRPHAHRLAAQAHITELGGSAAFQSAFLSAMALTPR